MFSTDSALRTARAVASVALALVFTGCVSEQLPPSIWPPADFSLTVEEVRLEGRAANVIRRFRVGADGVAVYGTSSQPLVDRATGVSLPVFDRLAIYQLEPDCVRALARRLDRLGITEIEGSAVDENGAATTGIVLFWRAFDREVELSGEGRLRGPFAEIIAAVAAHLPPGEAFDVSINRRVVPMLRGAPEPAGGTSEALAAYDDLIARCPDDATLLLDGFALACVLGRRQQAEQWLARWTAASAAERATRPAFRDGPAPLDPAMMAGFLPPG